MLIECLSSEKYWKIFHTERNHVSLCDVWVRMSLYETKSLSPCREPKLNRIPFLCENNKGFLFKFFFFCYSVGGGGYLDDVTWQHRFRYLYWAQPLERDGKSVSESEEIGKWKSFSAKCFEWVLRAGSTETDVKRRIFTHSTGDSNSKNHCKILLTFSVGQHVVILKPLLAISATFLALIYFCSEETVAVSVFYKHNK